MRVLVHRVLDATLQTLMIGYMVYALPVLNREVVPALVGLMFAAAVVAFLSYAFRVHVSSKPAPISLTPERVTKHFVLNVCLFAGLLWLRRFVDELGLESLGHVIVWLSAGSVVFGLQLQMRKD